MRPVWLQLSSIVRTRRSSFPFPRLPAAFLFDGNLRCGEEDVGGDLHCLADQDDEGPGRLVKAALDLADRQRVRADPPRESLLRPAERLAQLAKLISKTRIKSLLRLLC